MHGLIRLLLLAAGLMAIFACGGPEAPREEAKPGALGEAYGLATRPDVAEASPSKSKPQPYVTVRFDRPGIMFQDALYTALTRALDRYPSAEFDIVLFMPPMADGGSAEEAIRRGEQHIEDLVLAITDMGLPADRLRIAASTSDDASYDEIRIFVR